MQHLIERAQQIFEPIKKVKEVSCTEFEKQFALPMIPVIISNMAKKLAS